MSRRKSAAPSNTPPASTRSHTDAPVARAGSNAAQREQYDALGRDRYGVNEDPEAVQQPTGDLRRRPDDRPEAPGSGAYGPPSHFDVLPDSPNQPQAPRRRTRGPRTST